MLDKGSQRKPLWEVDIEAQWWKRASCLKIWRTSVPEETENTKILRWKRVGQKGQWGGGRALCRRGLQVGLGKGAGTEQPGRGRAGRLGRWTIWARKHLFLFCSGTVIESYKPENKRGYVHVSGTSHTLIWVTETYWSKNTCILNFFHY